LRLLVKQLLRHLFPGKAQVACHRHQAQSDGAPGREDERPWVAMIGVVSQEALDWLVCEVTGGDDVGQRGVTQSPYAPTLCQVDLDERTVPAAQFAERVQRLDHAGSLRPSAARACGEADHGHRPLAQRLHTDVVALPSRAGGTPFCRLEPQRIAHIVGLDVADLCAGGEAVLCQADAPAAKVGSNLLVLDAVKAVCIEQGVQALSAVLVVAGAGHDRVK